MRRPIAGNQWNGGEALEPFGLTWLGRRVYDPAIGRFLSRDPLRTSRTATGANPYAFANNDPWNLADPSGLCDGGIGQECQYLDSLNPFGLALDLLNYGGGGRGGGPSAAPRTISVGGSADGSRLVPHVGVIRGLGLHGQGV